VRTEHRKGLNSHSNFIRYIPLWVTLIVFFGNRGWSYYEDDLDLSNIDRLQIKVLNEMVKELQEVKDRMGDKINYKLPALNLCSYSLF